MMANYNPVHILTFNDYCLEAICKLLTLPDQINFALSCERFSAILNFYYRGKLENFNTSIMKNLALDQMHSFLRIVKPQSKTLTADLNGISDTLQKRVLALLENYFTNVEMLTVSCSSEPLSTLIQKMHCLQELELNSRKFDDEFMESLTTLKNLKALSIRYNSTATGSGISKLTGLEKLTLFFCHINLSHFEQICRNLTNLTYLHITSIRNNQETEAKYYVHIVQYLQQLRTLKIYCKPENYNWIAHLKNLKILHLVFSSRWRQVEIEKFFRYYAIHQENQLEELDTEELVLNTQIATSISELKKLKILKCKFPEDKKVMRIICNLKELEEVDFYPPLSDNGVLETLNNCFQLNTVRLWYICGEETDIRRRITEIEERQNKQALRTGATCHVMCQLIPGKATRPPYDHFLSHMRLNGLNWR